MNPITYSLNNLRMCIPREILEKTFISLDKTSYLRPISLDTIIRDKIIEAKVMVDCNLVGGKETYIPLIGLVPERISTYISIYRIPKTLTQGRTITRALSVSYGYGNAAGGFPNSTSYGGSLLDAASGVMQSQAPIPDVSTAQVTLIDENVVMVEDNVMLTPYASLRCRLENDANFNDLHPQAYPKFAKLVEYSTKSYIYVNNQIPMDRGYLSGGMDLNAYRNVIESYSDAQQNYEDYFNSVWRKLALMNDYTSHQRHLKLITGGNW